MATVRRILWTVAFALAVLMATAGPASAHSVAGVGGTNYRTTVHGVSPRVDGLVVRSIETGSRLELVNKTGQTVVVLGYEKEPYLRIDRRGVFENVRSPATYLNANRRGDTPIPGTASKDAPPQWKQISSGNTARWHDHRIHWMGNQDPPEVRRDRSRSHVVNPEWVVALEVGDQPTAVRVTGELVWVPPPPLWPWLLGAVVLLGLVALGAAGGGWRSVLVAAVVVLVAADVVHELGIAFANAGGLGNKLAQLLAGSFFPMVAWVLSVWAVRALLKGSAEGPFIAAFAGVIIALFGGVADVAALVNSQVPFVWSATLARLLVTVSLGIGLGLVAGAVIATAKFKLLAVEDDEDEAAQALR
jgi:hypothetical protein